MTYGQNDTPKPTKRRRRVVVFYRDLFSASEMGKGLQETMNDFNRAIDTLINSDINKFEDIIFN